MQIIQSKIFENCFHFTFSILIDQITDACLDTLKFQPNFDSADCREGMALQNLQARSRMVLAYLHAQTALIHAGSLISFY